MANSMFVPISRLPSSLDEVRAFVGDAFRELSLPEPRVQIEFRNPSRTSLKDGFITIEGEGTRNQCWVSIGGDYPPEITEDTDRSLLADVQTRGNWAFAGAVAYAFCRFSGRVIFNDARELDGQEKYSCDSLKEVLIAAWR